MMNNNSTKQITLTSDELADLLQCLATHREFLKDRCQTQFVFCQTQTSRTHVQRTEARLKRLYALEYKLAMSRES